MAVVEQVIIKVDIDADITGDLASIEARIKALEKRFADLDKAGGGVSRNIDNISDSTKRLDKNSNNFSNTLMRKVTPALNRFENGLKKTGKMILSFVKTLGKISFIALAAEVAVFSVALLGVKAALVGGRALVQGYQYAMKGLAVAAASVATGLAVAAAAMRQYQEAQLIPFMGGGVVGRQGAASLSRSYSSKTRGLYGSESLAAVTGSLARAGVSSGANSLLTQLYNMTGGDVKSAESIASQIVEARKSGDTSGLISALSGASGYAAGSISGGASLDSILQSIMSGSATSEAFKGVADDMSSTFIGSMKTEFESIKTMFADAGEMLLGPFQKAFEQIATIIKTDLLSVFQVIRDFGSGSLAPSLVSFADAVSEFVRSNIVKNVSDIAGTADKLKDFFGKLGGWYEKTKNWFKSYEAAANVVWDMVKAIFSSSENGLFRSFADLLVENKEAFIDFGAKIGEVVTALKNAFGLGNQSFFNSLDRLSNILDVFAKSIIPMIAELMLSIAPLLDKLPETLRIISDRLGPVLIDVAKALQPIADKFPEIVSGMMTVAEILGPIVSTLASAVSMLVDVVGGSGLGDLGLGITALALMGGKGKGSGMLSKLLGPAAAGGRAAGGVIRNVGGSALVGMTPFLNRYRYGVTGGKIGPPKPSMFSGKNIGRGIGGAAIGATMAYSGYNSIAENGANTANTLSTVGGAMMTGAALGSIIPGVGTAAGAIGGALVGAFVGGFLKSAAEKKYEETMRENARTIAGNVITNVIDTYVGGDIAGGFTDVERQDMQGMLDLIDEVRSIKVMSYENNTAAKNVEEMSKALVDWQTSVIPTFDTDERIGTDDPITGLPYISETRFKQELDTQLAFIRLERERAGMGQMIIDTTSDQFIALKDELIRVYGEGMRDFSNEEFLDVINDIYAAQTLALAEDQNRRERLAKSMGKAAEALDITVQELRSFTDTINLQLTDTFDEEGVKRLFEVFNAATIDMTQGFRPDFSNTNEAQLNAANSMRSAYKTLVASARMGEIDQAEVESFFDAYTTSEVMLGGDAAVSGISAIAALMKSPDFTDAQKGEMELDFLMNDLISQMADTFGGVVTEDWIRNLLGPNFNVDALAQGLEIEQINREKDYDLLYGTGSLENLNLADRAAMLRDKDFQELTLDTLTKAGFNIESFAKTVDLGGYAGTQTVYDTEAAYQAAVDMGFGAEIQRAFEAGITVLTPEEDPVVAAIGALAASITEGNLKPIINITATGAEVEVEEEDDGGIEGGPGS